VGDNSKRRCGRRKARRPPAASLLCSYSRCVPLAAAGMRNTQLSRPSYCRFEVGLKKRLAKAEKRRTDGVRERGEVVRKMFVRWVRIVV
jgi:hypothetical protein